MQTRNNCFLSRHTTQRVPYVGWYARFAFWSVPCGTAVVECKKPTSIPPRTFSISFAARCGSLPRSLLDVSRYLYARNNGLFESSIVVLRCDTLTIVSITGVDDVGCSATPHEAFPTGRFEQTSLSNSMRWHFNWLIETGCSPGSESAACRLGLTNCLVHEGPRRVLALDRFKNPA
jgi:hypothetical protein